MVGLTRVALLVETSTSWGAQIVRGVAEFSRRHAHWALTVEPHGRDEQLLLPAHWTGSGVIARVTSKALSEQIRRSKLPGVNVSWYPFGGPTLAQLRIDEQACADLALHHFLDRGFRRLGYLPASNRPDDSDPLGPAFRKQARAAGLDCHYHHVDRSATPERRLKDLKHWVAHLPKPIGVLAFSDIEGRRLLEVCQGEGLRVPEDVAVLGGEHDEIMAAVSDPPLSSVELPTLRLGFEAARLLGRMMAGEPCPTEPICIAPLGILTRQSTDTLAVDDPLVMQATRFICDNFRRPIQVTDIHRATKVSRRKLEQHFRASLGRSPAAEMRRIRLLYAQRLLADTATPITQVAGESGFNHFEVFARAFRRAFGVSPMGYRGRNDVQSLVPL